MRKYDVSWIGAIFMGLFASTSAFAASGVAPSAGNIGSMQQVAASVTTGSTQILAPATAKNFMSLCVPATAANGIWVNWVGGTAVTSAPSDYIPPGLCREWKKSSGFLPTLAVDAIAPAAVTATFFYN